MKKLVIFGLRSTLYTVGVQDQTVQCCIASMLLTDRAYCLSGSHSYILLIILLFTHYIHILRALCAYLCILSIYIFHST